MNKLPYIIQGQINKTIDESKVQNIQTNVQDENVSSLSYSQPSISNVKIRPEVPKISYSLEIFNNQTIGIKLTADPSLYDDIGSQRNPYGDLYSIIRDGQLLKEKITTPLSYVDSSIEYGKVYTYAVRIYAQDGSSNISSQLSISAIDSTIPHDPDDFLIYFDNPGDSKTGVAKIKFKQNFDNDYKGMRVLCKESVLPDTEWKEIKFINNIGAQGSEVITPISGLTEGKYYDISIQAQDFFGNLSKKNTQEGILIRDNVAPNPANNFSALLINDLAMKIKLSWLAPVALDGISDTSGYKIQRATITSGQQIYSDLTTITLPANLVFEDSTVESGRSYIYRISAFDENDNMSDYSYSNIVKAESITNSISMDVQFQNNGELTLPITITASNIPSSNIGNSFAMVINKKSTGVPVSNRKIVYRSSSSVQEVSVTFGYDDLLGVFISNISNETFTSNDFEVRFYEKIDSAMGISRFVDLSSKTFSIDFRPPAVQNFIIKYDAKNKKIYMSWDKPTFSILSGYIIKYSGKITQKTWGDSSLIKEILISDTLNTVIDVPPDIDLSDAQTLSHFSIKSVSRFNFSYIRQGRTSDVARIMVTSGAIESSTTTFSSITVYGKLPAITGQVVIGGAQEVNIKFTPLDLEGVSEYWIYASYTASDLNSPTDAMIEWKGKASIANIKKIAGVEIPNEIRTIYFKMLAVDYQQVKGVISDLFSGISHDSMVPEYTVSFSPNIIVEKLISGNSLSVSLTSNDGSGFSATGSLYVSLDNGEFVAKTYTRSNENKTITYSENFTSISDGTHKICFKIFDIYNNLLTTQWYPFEVDISIPSVLPAPYILKDNAFVQTQQIALSSKTTLPLTGASESIDIFNSKTVQVCLPEFTTCSNFSHIKMFIAQYNISTSSYGSYVEIKMPQSANLDSNVTVSNFKATVTFEEDMPDFKIKMIQVKKNGVIGDINSAIASSKNKIDTTPPLIKVNSIRYENDITLENVANNNYINSRIINGGLIIDLTIIETNSGLWSNSIDVENLKMPVYYQVNGGAKTPLLEYGSPMFKSPFFIPKEKFSSFAEGEKITITIYAMDNALKIGSLNIVKIMNKIAPDNITSQKAIFGVESNKPVIKISYTKPLDPDLSGIRLYEGDILLKETLGEVMSIPTSSGGDRTFVLKSVDVADNESSGVSFTAHNYAPSTVTGLVAEPDINALSLSWTHVTTDTNGDLMTDLKYYEVSYSKWNGVIVEKTVSNRFLIQLSKEDMTYYNTNQSVSITDIKIRAIDYFDLAGSYCTPTTGRPRFIEAVDMTDNVFKFVGTSNRFEGDLSILFDNSFRSWSVASIIPNDWVQIDMLKPDFISEIKLKFAGFSLSSSTAIRFIVAYYDCSTSTKAWKYISASNSSHDIGTAVDRQTDEATAKSRYFEYTVIKTDPGFEADKANAFSISMLKTGLSKATFYASAVKIIFLSSCIDLGFTAFLPKTRSIYNEFYGDVMYLSSMAAIRSSEDPDTYMTLDKEKLTLTENTVFKLKLGKLYDNSYGLWAYNNIWLGGDENAPQMKISPDDIKIGRVSSEYYNTQISNGVINLGYVSEGYHNIKMSSNDIMMGYLGGGLYNGIITSTGNIRLGRDAINGGYRLDILSDGLYLKGASAGYDLILKHNYIGIGKNGTTGQFNTLISDSAINLGSVDSSGNYNTNILSDSIQMGYNGTYGYKTLINSTGIFFKNDTSYYDVGITASKIGMGYYDSSNYRFELTSSSVKLGYNFIYSKHDVLIDSEGFKTGATSGSYYNAHMTNDGSIKLGHISGGIYTLNIDTSGGDNYLSMRNSDPSQLEFFRVGKFSYSVYSKYTMWAKSLFIDPSGYSNEDIAMSTNGGLWIVGSSGAGGSALHVEAGTGTTYAAYIYSVSSQIGIECISQNGNCIQATASGDGYGVSAYSNSNDGVHSISNSASKTGVYGGNQSGGYGVKAYSSGSYSLYSEKSFALYGQMYATNMAAGVGTHAVKWNNTTGQLTYDNSSSLRYKHDIERLSFDINQYNNILPSKFKYNYDNSNDIGFIAEEMATLFPDIVIFDKNGQPDTIKYDRISVYNVLANQYNNKKIQELEKQISDLKTLVDCLLNK